MGQQSPPSAPDPSKTFKEGIQTWLQYLPKLVKSEDKYRRTEDPKRLAQQQALQAQFGPTQYNQQLQALQQLDPTGYGLREALGQDITGALQRGRTDPRQQSVYNQLGAIVTRNLAQGGVDPTQVAGYRALGQGALGDYNRGYSIPPDLQREISNVIGARQAASGNYRGNAANMAAAVYTGQRGQALRQQRTGNLQNFLGLQAPELLPFQQGLAYQGQQTPQERTFAQAGSFASLPGITQQVAGIQGVNPDRGFSYANPNAGYMGQQYGLQNYPNQVAAQGSNPWAQALGAVGTAVGSYYGGPIGGAAGGYTSGLIGNSIFGSDPRMKTNVKKVADIPIYEYKYKPEYGIKGTFRSPMSTDVKKHDPGAVVKVFGHDFVLSNNSLGLNRVKVKEE